MLPKLVAYKLIEPALGLQESYRIICREGSNSDLLPSLAVHDLDVVLTDALELEDLDYSEFEASFDSVTLALASHLGALAPYRHHLESARRYRPYLLSEPEERILAEKALTSSSAWSRLFEEQTAAIEIYPEPGGRMEAELVPLVLQGLERGTVAGGPGSSCS